MFICKGKCNSLGLITLVNCILSMVFLFYFIICSYNSKNCNVLFIFLLIFISLSIIYLYFWSIESIKKTRVHPINNRNNLDKDKDTDKDKDKDKHSHSDKDKHSHKDSVKDKYIYREMITINIGEERTKVKGLNNGNSKINSKSNKFKKLKKYDNSYLYKDNHLEFDEIVIL